MAGGVGELVLAIDQGTTSSRALVVDRGGRVVAEAQAEHGQVLPRPGWVEHDAAEIWANVRELVRRVGEGRWGEIAGIGITNQRETTVLWDRETGRPVHNAIVWQDRRTAERCAGLAGEAEAIRATTGLVVDAYFSATKLEWLLENVAGARAAAERGALAFGTIDAWLVWNLTGGRAHMTDFTNASRTMLYDIHGRNWDRRLLQLFKIPESVLPAVVGSSGVVGETEAALTGGRAIPIAGMAGDQQAALFGQTCWGAGEAKNTYGTGAFLLMNTGERAVASKHRLLTTLACDERGRAAYALEASVFVAGAAVQWLRDGLGVICSSQECEGLARSVEDNGGVYFVPAFVGLGAPHWRSDVRGAVFGLTRGSNRAHLVRAACEAMAYQSKQVLDVMSAEAGGAIAELKVDGGATRNDWLMQYQAEVLGVPVVRAKVTETTALGAAFLAGLATGVWGSASELRALVERGDRFEPSGAGRARGAYEAWVGYLGRLL